MTEDQAGKGTRNKLPSVFYNTISIVGGGLAALSLGLIIFLTVLEALAEEHRPYMGIIAFIILPIFLLAGVALFIIGAVRERRRRSRGESSINRLLRIDLNDPRQLRATILFTVGGILLLVMSGMSSYKVYEYTDSNKFCGTTCHQVMQPEYTAYNVSPHARVDCVKCHIGPGAAWFARAKLSGAYQVYATLLNKYPRPIQTPIKNLRPSRDTCEQCHWPAHFYNEKLVVHDYFGSEEDNPHWRLHLLMKIGGGHEDFGPAQGIHWHMNINNEIHYIATDEKRLEIPWIKSVSSDGTEKIFRNTEIDISDEELATHEMRQMDCIDCHNRPTHHYNPPSKLVNRALALGQIDVTLPALKETLVELLDDADYETTPEATEAIASGLRAFYADDYPEISQSRAADIEQAVSVGQQLFQTNIFPEMKVSWRNFPDHIGHLYSPGCFRCHDGLHETEDGEVLTRDCNVCHTIVAQELKSHEKFVSLESVAYQHPVDIDEEWKETSCSDCHAP